MNINQAIQKIINKNDLTEAEMQIVMTEIMTGKVSEPLISGFLCSLATKGESVDEILGAVKVMRELSTKVEFENTKHLVDTCGTGGDGSGFLMFLPPVVLWLLVVEQKLLNTAIAVFLPNLVVPICLN
jgi:anthranilate phosphoribosyltransferase